MAVESAMEPGPLPSQIDLTDEEANVTGAPQSAEPQRQSRFVVGVPRPVPPFPIVLHRTVQRYVSEYLESPARLERCFARSQPYFSEMLQIFRAHRLPDDMVYLAFAESAFSQQGRGPWQFSASTARNYGLRIDSWLDERRDPILSTKAAAQHLADLHDAAGRDWWVAIAAWNIGLGAIGRYWSLRGHNFEKFAEKLPERTRTLLGRFMAVAFIAHNAPAYGIGPSSSEYEPDFRMVDVKGGISLATVARRHGTTIAQLRELNPALLRDAVPPDVETYAIRVPVGARDRAGAASAL
jgi:membrane-bound lytic murein transglycosylase D